MAKILTIADSLKGLYAKLGGTPADVEDTSTVTEMIQEITEVAGSGGGSGGGGAFVVNITAADGETTIDKSYAEILSAHQAGSIIFAQIEADDLPDGLCTVILNFDEVFSRFISYYSTFNFVDDGEGTLAPEPVYMHAVVSVNAGETYAQITI